MVPLGLRSISGPAQAAAGLLSWKASGDWAWSPHTRVRPPLADHSVGSPSAGLCETQGWPPEALQPFPACPGLIHPLGAVAGSPPGAVPSWNSWAGAGTPASTCVKAGGCLLSHPLWVLGRLGTWEQGAHLASVLRDTGRTGEQRGEVCLGAAVRRPEAADTRWGRGVAWEARNERTRAKSVGRRAEGGEVQARASQALERGVRLAQEKGVPVRSVRRMRDYRAWDREKALAPPMPTAEHLL